MPLLCSSDRGFGLLGVIEDRYRLADRRNLHRVLIPAGQQQDVSMIRRGPKLPLG
jgi:hypothetical protein